MESPRRKPTSVAQSHWRNQLRTAHTTPHTLLAHLGLAEDSTIMDPKGTFGMRVPEAFVDRMRPGDRLDPLLLQVLPIQQEQTSTPGYLEDPVGDMPSRQGRGLLHKYHGRALLITTGACAVHCRYCFRQNFPYATDHVAGLMRAQAIDYIANDRSIEEVILSGGDPLMLSTKRLGELTDALAQIPHIKTLRIHTRLPIVLPDRITPNLLRWLASSPWQVVVVIHANHANEFDPKVDQALDAIGKTGAHLLNQAVLLQGINDGLEPLVDLMKRSFQAGALPYYLHRLDRVRGAHRFEVEDQAALGLMDGLRKRLSGYLVPRFVKEEPGAPYKVPIL